MMILPYAFLIGPLSCLQSECSAWKFLRSGGDHLDHLLSVRNKGNERISSHNAIRDSFCDMCRAAGLTTRIEDMETLKQGNIDTKSRVDAINDNFLPGIPMAFDHSIADPRQSGLSLKPIPGKAAKKREHSKVNKFRDNLARQGTRFEPFVLESYGRWGYI